VKNPLLRSNKIKRYIKEGRGQGTGKNYIPWTKTYSREFSSKGRVTRVMGVKTQRIHYLQSDNQYRAFLTFEFCPAVIDIRESFPLLDVYEIIDEIDDLRFDKFRDKGTKEPYALTTNFLLTVNQNDDKRLIARSIKNVSELNRKITWEKLEIERRYWAARNIDWKLITNKELSNQRAKNIEWVRETLFEDRLVIDDELTEKLFQHCLQNRQHNLRGVLSAFDNRESLNKGTALYLFRYLVATNQLKINMHQPIQFNKKVQELF